MPDRGSNPAGPDRDPAHIDIDVAQPARMGDYLLGGDSSFSVDRSVVDHAAAGMAGGTEAAQGVARTGWAFLDAAVEYLASQAGNHQFLNLGTRIPTGGNVHEVAQRVTPQSRVVYVFHDPVVLAHAHALLKSRPEGKTAFVHSALRDADAILGEAGNTLDLDQPVAVLLYGVLPFIDSGRTARRLVTRFLAAVPSGSHLVVSHVASDIGHEMVDVAKRLDEVVGESLTRGFWPRTHGEVLQLMEGVELVEPGLVPVDQWLRHHGTTPPTGETTIPIYGAVGRKP